MLLDSCTAQLAVTVKEMGLYDSRLSEAAGLMGVMCCRSFILLWLLGLPFAFVSSLGWWSILVCTVVGYGEDLLCSSCSSPKFA